jgi:hypothetical protein
MRKKERLFGIVASPRAHVGELPADLSHPPDVGRASFIANVVTATFLGCVVLAMLVYALLVVRW